MPAQTSPRRAAKDMLDRILGQGRLMAEVMAQGALEGLEPADRARAQRLTLDTLRAMERLDRMLQRHLRKPPPLPVRNILRLGALELCTGGDAHGVVNEAVEIAASGRKTEGLKGLVNAVLRKIAAETDRYETLRAPRLPKWLRDPLVMAWGAEAVAGMERAQFAGAPLDLTPRDPAAADTLAATLGAEILPTGTLRLAEPGQVSRLPGFDEGAWWVQDAAAALPARILAPQPGERVLDLCAAPGGKTLQLAAAGAEVTALDISETRLARLRENLARTGLSARVVAADVFEFDETGFDAILLDAPCSATGTIRRHPDLPHAKDGSEFGALIAMQGEMIDHALTLLKPGGRLLYCTCSLLPDEGEVQAEEALARHPGLAADRAALDLPGVEPGWITEEGGLRLRPDYWPDRGGMDGFYMTLLRR
ncbi:methyltransferase domain-containing protein [Aquicoccus sp. SCR17]|nr:methyltransferase domain-containing protein [Carideicomes alvinocaridis]